MRVRSEMVLQGVAVEPRTPYGEGVIDIDMRNATEHRQQAIAPPGTRPVVRRDA
jgi:hypothetical protein